MINIDLITGSLISGFISSFVTLFIVAVGRTNREHDIYIEGYIAGTKAKENEDRFGVKECAKNE